MMDLVMMTVFACLFCFFFFKGGVFICISNRQPAFFFFTALSDVSCSGHVESRSAHNLVISVAIFFFFTFLAVVFRCPFFFFFVVALVRYICVCADVHVLVRHRLLNRVSKQRNLNIFSFYYYYYFSLLGREIIIYNNN
ncbi:hypothetical protein, unlikely [Trypanosoma brucei brucei TREU927]|uniref:Uncharacterized protein n=1 Tax=Trypanosoma brucei brucei (strain 927/4 GUTat10.1) TaxID=185431 RepID=Q38EJ8_TRYB2|nr:hypothetical protein, unlikely [Trypanosoma brucei brucei TREU927]EAN76772.1 hypothetical protein, unlikely [Trypanosoma brucei brucei TREU927]